MKRILPFLSLFLAGCGNRTQSVLDPGGDQAASIAQLSSIVFVGGAFIFLLVVIAIAFAVGGPPAVKRALSSERAIVSLGIAFPIAVLTALLIYGLWQTRLMAFPPPMQPCALTLGVSNGGGA
jgi:heme/copper-type cytochrome/quinol oxidase subunit 2